MKHSAALFCLLAVCLLDVGCGQNPLLKWSEEQCVEIERLAKLLDEIDSPAAADERIDDIRQCYVKMIQSKREGPALFRKHAQDKVLKSSSAALQKRIQRAELESAQAVEKLNARNDLSEPFCSMLRMQSVEFVVATVELLQEINKLQGVPRQPFVADLDSSRELLALYKEHGPAKVVEIAIERGDSDTPQELVNAAEGDPTGLIAADDSAVCIGPINDFDAYRTKLESQGTVSDVDPGRRSFTFTPNHAASPVAASRSGIDHQSLRGMSHDERVAAMRNRHEELRREAFAGFDDNHFADDRFDAPPSRGGSMAGSDAAATGDSPWRDEEEEPAAPAPQPVWPIGRQDASSSAPAPAARAASLKHLSPRDQEHLRLAEELNSGDRFAIRSAAAKLLEVRPTDIKNSDVRRMVARGYRSLLKDSNFMMTDGDTAIRGLELYAGKHSVPLVIAYLNTKPLRVPAAAVETLRKHRTPQGVAALIQLLGVASASEAAAEALREAGPDAEAPLLAVVLKLDSAAMPLVLELLGEVGTPRSYRVLQQAAKKSQPGVRSAANDALRRIRQRD